jgi:hypothetical protein
LKRQIGTREKDGEENGRGRGKYTATEWENGYRNIMRKILVGGKFTGVKGGKVKKVNNKRQVKAVIFVPYAKKSKLAKSMTESEITSRPMTV